MNGVMWLIPVALAMGGIGLGAFVWSLGTRQYEDIEGDAVRILSPDDRPDVGAGAPASRKDRTANRADRAE